ncbi:MAG TPA: dipeptide/oligopeptide/nickel ABC transporter permease/ATP-binding protein [Devosiaceae bacterium]
MTAPDASSGNAPATSPVLIVPRAGLVRKVLTNPLGLVSVIILAIVIIVAILAPWIVPNDPNHGVLRYTNSLPGGVYLLGGDSSGRDIFSRLIASTRVSMTGAVIGTSVALCIGVLSGLIAGYFGGVADGVASWTSNLLQTVPNIVVLMALYAAIGASMPVAMVVFGVLASPSFHRLVRGLVVGVRKELFVDAARVSGLSTPRIVGRHVLFAVRAPIIIQTSFIAGTVIGIQAGLEFLGLGDPNASSWGGMLENAFANLYRQPIQIIWPGLALTITIAAFILFGNAVRDALEGRTAGSKARSRIMRRHKAAPEPLRAANANAGSTSSADAVLSIRDLAIGYPNDTGAVSVVVNGVSLDVFAGEILGLVGESGSGKSQTAFAALGLLPRSAMIMGGTVVAEGIDMVKASAKDLAGVRGRVMGYIPQEPMSSLDPAFTVGAQLVYAIRAAEKVTKTEARERAVRLLARVGIADPARTFASYPHEISGGMAQRVLIAGAVIANPKLLVADEPTTALDVTVQAEVLDLIRDLQRERGMGVLLVTHNFGVVADICDRVAVMHDGKIVETGLVQDIFDNPQHPYTQRLLNSILDENSIRSPLKASMS